MIHISNADDIIDSRDVIARIEELEDERAELETIAEEAAAESAAALEALEECDADPIATRNDDARAALVIDLACAEEAHENARDALSEWDASNSAELATLKALADEASGYAADWQYGEALIRDSHFKEYAQELAEDIGAINRDAAWPNNCIDWDQAARELQMDYTSVEFDGVTYWYR